MDRCPQCNKRMMPVLSENGRTELLCLECDKADPLKTEAVKRADGPLPTKAA